MRYGERTGVPPEVGRVQDRFAAWRKTKKGRDRIPESLWSAAARLCGRYGVNRVSRWLRLNHSVLRDHAGNEKRAARNARGSAAPAFVEWVPAGSSSAPEYVVEVEGARGMRMRVRLRGVGVTEVAALARSLREEAG